MVKRCVFGCFPPKTLFPFPKLPWLRARWLEFVHFEEGGISESSRLCARHFAPECFRNLKQHEMGFAEILYLTDTAVPTVYTVGASPSLKPVTRETGCQCDTPSLRTVAIQALRSKPKPKKRSKAIQVKPLGQSVSVSCSTENFDESPDPPFTLIPVKRPCMEQSTAESTADSSYCKSEPTDTSLCKSEPTDTSLCKSEPTDSSLCKSEPTDTSLCKSEPTDSSYCKSEPTDFTIVPDVTQEDNEKFEPCESSYIIVTI